MMDWLAAGNLFGRKVDQKQPGDERVSSANQDASPSGVAYAAALTTLGIPDVRALRQENDRLKEQLALADRKCEAYLAQQNKMQSDLAATLSENNEAKDKVQELERGIDIEKGKHDFLNNTIEVLAENLNIQESELKAERDRFKNKELDYRILLDNFQSEQVKHKAEIKKHDAESTHLRKKIALAHKERNDNDAERRLAITQNWLKEINSKEKVLKEKEKKFGRIRERERYVSDELRRADEEIVRLKKDIDFLERNKAVHEANQLDLIAKNKQLDKELYLLKEFSNESDDNKVDQSVQAGNDDRVKDLEQDLADLRAKYNNLHSEDESVKQEFNAELVKREAVHEGALKMLNVELENVQKIALEEKGKLSDTMTQAKQKAEDELLLKDQHIQLLEKEKSSLCAELEKACEEAKNRLCQKEAEIKGLQEELKKRVEVQEQLKAERDAMQRDMAKNNVKSQEAIDIIQKKLEVACREKERKDQEIDMFKEEKKDVLKKHEQNLLRHREDRVEYKDKLDRLNKDLAEAFKEKDIQNQEIKALKHELNTLVEKHKKEVEQLHAQLGRANGEASKQLSLKNREVEELNKKLHHLYLKSGQEKAQLEHNLLHEQDKGQLNEQKLQALMEENNALQQEKLKGNEAAHEKDRQNQTLREQLLQLQAQLEDGHRNAVGLEQVKDRLYEDLQSAEQQGSLKDRKIQALSQESTALASQLKTAEDRSHKLQHQLQEQKVNFEAEYKKSQQSIHRLQEHNQQLQQQNAQLTEKASQHQKEAEQLKRRVTKAQTQVQSLSAENTLLTLEKLAAQADLDRLEASQDELCLKNKKNIQQLQAEKSKLEQQLKDERVARQSRSYLAKQQRPAANDKHGKQLKGLSYDQACQYSRACYSENNRLHGLLPHWGFYSIRPAIPTQNYIGWQKIAMLVAVQVL